LLASLAQRPSHGFVDQVVVIFKQKFGDSERVFDLACLNEGERRDDRDAAFPEIAGLRQPVQNLARSHQKMIADDVGGGAIH